ncbi:MAG: flagellar basal body rod protein [Marinovum sp.]|jgi:peptidoglycan hydrolase FlgJ|nr:flagellar basal body rod protein [Marinovum sp.]MBT7908177.1 flagellar basal body rod protein [Marinovum sp.]
MDDASARLSSLTTPVTSSMSRISPAQTTIEEVAEQFEALLVNELMKSSRAAKLSEDLLNNSGSKPFLQMMDQELSQTVSQHNNLGIAEALIRQFEQK